MPAQQPPFRANPYLLLTLTALFWSGNMVLGRGIRADVPPLALAFWRWAIAFALVLPLALPHLKEQWPLLKKGWKPVVILGFIGVGGITICCGWPESWPSRFVRDACRPRRFPLR